MIEVTHFYGVHQGGTKDYHLYLLFSKKTGKHIIVKRWGKTGTDGQAKVELGSGDGSTLLDKWLKERASKGYDMRPEPVPLAPGKSSYDSAIEALEANLPRSIARNLTNAQVAKLDPSHAGGSGGSTYDPLAAERARLTEEMQKAAAEAQAQAQAAEKAAADEILKSNPLYGMF